MEVAQTRRYAPSGYVPNMGTFCYAGDVRIIARRTLRDFWNKGPWRDSEQPLRAWFAEARKAEWRSPHDIKSRYRSASMVGHNRVVFNIGGNKYRLVVAVRYDMGIVFIRFIGTHRQYNRIKAGEV